MNQNDIKALLSDLPKVTYFHRKPLKLMTGDGRKFTLSIQAGSFLYSHPREDLERLTDYKDVEIALIDEGVERADGHPEWLKLEDVGIPLEADFQDVYPYVSLESLIAALAKFVNRGGMIINDVVTVPESEKEDVRSAAESVLGRAEVSINLHDGEWKGWGPSWD